MRKIHSSFTYFQKYALPAGLVLLFFFRYQHFSQELKTLPRLLIVVSVVLILVWLQIKVYWPLMDEVYDYGNFLEVRRGRNKERIAIEDIRRVTIARSRVPVIVINLHKACRFGKKIRFIPPLTVFNFNNLEVYEDLKSKIKNT